MQNDLLSFIPSIEPEEAVFLKDLTKELNPEQQRIFIQTYVARRQKPDNILIFTLLGFVGIAGVQRFVVGHIGMGILYFLTAGLCFIGTIIDIVNHKQMALEFNQQKAYEALSLAKMGNGGSSSDLYYRG